MIRKMKILWLVCFLVALVAADENFPAVEENTTGNTGDDNAGYLETGAQDESDDDTDDIEGKTSSSAASSSSSSSINIHINSGPGFTVVPSPSAGPALGPAPGSIGPVLGPVGPVSGPAGPAPGPIGAGPGSIGAGPGPTGAGPGPISAGPGPGPIGGGVGFISAGSGPIGVGPGPIAGGAGPIGAGPGPIGTGPSFGVSPGPAVGVVGSGFGGAPTSGKIVNQGLSGSLGSASGLGAGSGIGGAFGVVASGTGGGFGGVTAVSGNNRFTGRGCRYFCKGPHGRYVCCEIPGQSLGQTPINVHSVGFGFFGVIKPGYCPPIRPVCPGLKQFPVPCTSDVQCAGLDKCCFDTCLEHHTCKPPIGFGR
ncbi:hypothetical protein SK128_013928 [Halocaridina rubra]|uniref:WAP domain-containing protein n=1 Tax=Halocaridina rubra TaxID=373956 RepID=A0AAN8X6J3_HALRR